MANAQHRYRKLPAMLGVCCWLAAPVQAAAPLTLYAEDYPPYSWVDKASGKPTGLSADLVTELMQRAGLTTVTHDLVPWGRAMMRAATTPRTCLYTTARVPEREASYQWVGPIGRNEWVLFARRSDAISLRTLDEASPYKIGTAIGDASIGLLRAHNLQVDIAPDDRVNPDKLLMQRIQLWSVGRLPGLYLQREMGIKTFQQVLSLTQTDMYLACSKDMPRDEITRLNTILRGMYQDGTVQRIYSRYGYGKDAPHAPAPASSR